MKKPEPLDYAKPRAKSKAEELAVAFSIALALTLGMWAGGIGLLLLFRKISDMIWQAIK